MLLIQIHQNYIILTSRQQIPHLINDRDVFATDIQMTYLTPFLVPTIPTHRANPVAVK